METARTVLAAKLPGPGPGLISITQDRVFLPQTTHDMLIWRFSSRGSVPGEPSFATISAEPLPEMWAAGHDG